MPIKQLDFSLAYHFAGTTLIAVNAPDEIGIKDVLDEFLGANEEIFFQKAFKPHKTTLLHDFIHNVNYHAIEFETGHADHDHLIRTYGPAIKAYGYETPNWFNINELGDHIHELDDLLESVSRSISEAAFHVLFADRDFLFQFSNFVGRFIRDLDITVSDIFKKKSVIKRHPYIPKWLRNAIFHRDKGRCQICTRDLTGLMAPYFGIHLDHMLPLEQSGTSDPTNFQLLCSNCNTRKGKNPIVTKQLTFTYW